MFIGLPIALIALLVGPAAADPDVLSAPLARGPRALAVDGLLPRIKTTKGNVKRFHAGPAVGFGSFSVDLTNFAAEPSSLQKRGANGSIIALASEKNTFAIPVGLGDPGLAYPVQLDTGTADLLLVSTACGDKCPSKTDSNPYYNTESHSSTFISVNNNETAWSTHYGDGTVASGFVARERVSIAKSTIEGQVFGLINATNMTVAEQKVSGMLGLGFPRLSTITRALLHSRQVITGSSQSLATSAVSAIPSTSAGDPAVPDGAATATSTSPSEVGGEQVSAEASMQRRQETSAPAIPPGSSALPSVSTPLVAPAAAEPSLAAPVYLPPVLESLFSKADMPYPAFGLALAPPFNATNTTAATPETASIRYAISTGSLTLGGVSELYVSSNASTGRTINDIQWWPVVPFGPLNTSSPTLPSPSPAPSDPAASAAVGGIPTTAAELEEEAYLYWTLELTNVAVNGTGVGLNSSYSSIGVPSVALLDLGTNGIYGPQQDVETIFRNITNARQVNTGQWAVPCDTNVTMGFSFGGRYVELQPQDWIYSAVSGSTMCLAWPVATPSTGDGVDWQLGTPFLKTVYTVFSYGINGVQPPQVGFLPLKDVAPEVNGTAAPTTVIPASPTATVGTTLPNQLLTGPDYSTPAYIFSGVVPTGAVQTMGLANASIFSVGAVPVVSLPRVEENATTTPNVPGWPGNASQHTTDSGSPSGRVPLLLTLLVAAAAAAL